MAESLNLRGSKRLTENQVYSMLRYGLQAKLGDLRKSNGVDDPYEEPSFFEDDPFLKKISDEFFEQSK